MSRGWDVVVIGGGAGGLALAGLLGRRGKRVLLCERAAAVGGLAASHEFWPGYRSAGLLQETSALRESVVRELGLERHGLKRLAGRDPVLALVDDTDGFVVRGDTLDGVGAHDAERFVAYRTFIDRVRPVLADFLERPPVDFVHSSRLPFGDLLARALRLRRLGRVTMMELLRLPPMCVADVLAEWFADDRLRSALALPAVAGGYLGPRQPGTALNLLLDEAGTGRAVVGGAPALVAALERAARAAGVEIRTNTEVATIRALDGVVRGVTISGGDEIDAPVVAATCDPKRALLGLLPRGTLEVRTEHRLEQFRMRGTTAQILLAVDRAPRLGPGDGPPIERARLAPGIDELERAFDAVKYGAVAESPALELHVPSISDPTRAPGGHGVIAVLVHGVPHAVDQGWDEARRTHLGDRVLSMLEPHLPGLGASVVGREVLAPPDLERRYGLGGGQIQHGEHALDQLLVRPIPECVGYRTPIAGLFLAGGGSHPGGGLTCAPAALAARTILATRG